MSFNRHTEEELFLVRPRFKLYSNIDKKEILDRISKKIATTSDVNGACTENRCFLSIPENDRHFWSPELQIEITDNRHDEDDYDFARDTDTYNTTIRCVIGPKQSIWAMFVFGFSLAGVIIFFGGMYGLVQMNLYDKSPFLWCFPIGIAMILSLYAAAAYGRKKGHQQMLHLIHFLYKAIDDNHIVRK